MWTRPNILINYFINVIINRLVYFPMLHKHPEIIFTYIQCILILSKIFYSPTDAQVNCLKNNFKIYIEVNIETLILILM